MRRAARSRVGGADRAVRGRGAARAAHRDRRAAVLCTATAGDGTQLRHTTAAVLGAARLSAARRRGPARAHGDDHARARAAGGGGACGARARRRRRAPAGLAGLERATARGAFAQLGADERAQLARRSAPRCRASPRAPSATRSAPCSALATPAPAPPAAAAAASPRRRRRRCPSSSSVCVGGLRIAADSGTRAAQEMLTAELGKWGGVAKVTLKLLPRILRATASSASCRKRTPRRGQRLRRRRLRAVRRPEIVLNWEGARRQRRRRKRRRTRKRRRRRRRSPRSRRCARRAPRCTWVGCTDRSSTTRRRRWRRAGKWGDVAKVTLKRFKNSGYGFVAFSSQKDAEAAVSAYVAGSMCRSTTQGRAQLWEGARRQQRRRRGGEGRRETRASARLGLGGKRPPPPPPPPRRKRGRRPRRRRSGATTRRAHRCTSPRSCPARRPRS